MVFLKTILFLLPIIFLPSYTYATGPSYADIEIVPLAINQKNQILFKTKSHINNMGGHNFYGLEYGWLVASASGLWKEVVQDKIEIGDTGKKVDLLEKQYKAPIWGDDFPRLQAITSSN